MARAACENPEKSSKGATNNVFMILYSPVY
jgi:hypothetical protein